MHSERFGPPSWAPRASDNEPTCRCARRRGTAAARRPIDRVPLGKLGPEPAHLLRAASSVALDDRAPPPPRQRSRSRRATHVRSAGSFLPESAPTRVPLPDASSCCQRTIRSRILIEVRFARAELIASTAGPDMSLRRSAFSTWRNSPSESPSCGSPSLPSNLPRSTRFAGPPLGLTR